MTRRPSTPLRQPRGPTARERLDRVASMLTACLPHRTIVRRLSAEWRIGHRQARRYIQAVYLEWAAAAREAGPGERDRVREALRQAYRVAMRQARAGETRALGHAVTALDRLARLDGLYAPEKLEHSGLPAGNFGFRTDEQRDARIRELLKKHPDLIPPGGDRR